MQRKFIEGGCLMKSLRQVEKVLWIMLFVLVVAAAVTSYLFSSPSVGLICMLVAAVPLVLLAVVDWAAGLHRMLEEGKSPWSSS